MVLEQNPGTAPPAFVLFSNDAGTKLEVVCPSNPLPTANTPAAGSLQNVNLTQVGGVSVTSPLPVAPAATEVHLGQVGGTAAHLTNSPTITAGAYTSGQVVGGLISLTGAARVNTGSGIVQTVIVTVRTALTAPYDVLFFDTNPTNSTFTDNSNLAVNVADLPFLCGVAQCTNVVSLGTPQALQAANLALPFKLSAAATTLYAVVVIRGAQTFASTAGIQLSVEILQD